LSGENPGDLYPLERTNVERFLMVVAAFACGTKSRKQRNDLGNLLTSRAAVYLLNGNEISHTAEVQQKNRMSFTPGNSTRMLNSVI